MKINFLVFYFLQVAHWKTLSLHYSHALSKNTQLHLSLIENCLSVNPVPALSECVNNTIKKTVGVTFYIIAASENKVPRLSSFASCPSVNVVSKLLTHVIALTENRLIYLSSLSSSSTLNIVTSTARVWH